MPWRAGPRLVVSTPGAEPVAPDGYAAALLLDAWALLERPSLTAGEEALRRWLAAAALVRPASRGGRVVLAGAPTEVSIPAVEALVRWDPAWFADRELDERRELSLPPAARLAVLTGARPALEAATAELDLPAARVRAGAAAARVPRPMAHPGHRATTRRAGPGPRARRDARPRLGPQGPRPGLGAGRPARPHGVTGPALRAPRLPGVSVTPIRLFGDPVLRTPAEPVVDFDAELRRLVGDLTDTMLDAGAAGLAAPQLGVGLRVFTYNVDGVVGHLVNPDLTLGDEEETEPEGCLSLPGLRFDTPRAVQVVARGWNGFGEPVTVEGTHLLARAVQHETDHLDGILFVDRLDPEQRREAMRLVREADWGAAAPGGQGQPARRRVREALSATRPRRHPRDRGALAAGPARLAPRGGRPSSPAPTPGPGADAPWRRRRSSRSRSSTASRC